MCECLEYDDGSMYLCECCTGIWKDYQDNVSLVHGELRAVQKLLKEWMYYENSNWEQDPTLSEVYKKTKAYFLDEGLLD